MWNISRMAYITEVIPLADRGRALSTFGGISRIGVFAGPAVGGLIGVTYGLGAPFLASAVLAAMALVISGLLVPETHTAPADARPHLRWQVVGDVARQHWRDLSTAGVAQIFAQIIRAGRQIIVPLYGSSVLGLDVAQVGAIVSISAAIDMSLFIPAGMIMDRFGRKVASVPSFTILGIGMAMVPFAHDYTSLLLATCVMALGNGLGSGAMMTLGADLAPREATGEFLGVWRLIGDVGGTAGPIMVGSAADAVGLAYAAFLLAAMGFVAAGTLALFVRETLAQPSS
jgi:MFS family permease